MCRLDNGWRVTVSGNLEEIGESSALVLTETKVRRGTKVAIRCKTRELKGVVESCTLHEGLGFFVGSWIRLGMSLVSAVVRSPAPVVLLEGFGLGCFA